MTTTCNTDLYQIHIQSLRYGTAPSSPGDVCWTLASHTRRMSVSQNGATNARKQAEKQETNHRRAWSPYFSKSVIHLEYSEQNSDIEPSHTKAPAECCEDERH